MKILGTFGILYIAFHLSDLTTKFIYNSLPRQLIENTNDKAVVITGMQSHALKLSLSVKYLFWPKFQNLFIFDTGCDSGFGNALAIKLDSIGFKVYAGCLDVRGEGPQELKTKCSKRLNLIPLDVTKSDQVSAATHLVASTLEDRSMSSSFWT